MLRVARCDIVAFKRLRDGLYTRSFACPCGCFSDSAFVPALILGSWFDRLALFWTPDLRVACRAVLLFSSGLVARFVHSQTTSALPERSSFATLNPSAGPWCLPGLRFRALCLPGGGPVPSCRRTTRGPRWQRKAPLLCFARISLLRARPLGFSSILELIRPRRFRGSRVRFPEGCPGHPVPLPVSV